MKRQKEKFTDIIRDYFGNFPITWTFVIVFALLAAVISAAVCIIKPLGDTSLHDISVYPDVWILFAVFIVINCRKWWEAALKCFVFFLVSQPLIYLLQVPFSPDGFGIFRYYKYWFMITLLTLPGGAVAFFLKKKNLLSVLILSVANGYYAYAAVQYFEGVRLHFPGHILSLVFCIAVPVFLSLVLFDKAWLKTVSIALFAVMIAGVVFFPGFSEPRTDMYLDEGNWSCTVEDESVVTVEITDGNHAAVTGVGNGSCDVRFTRDDGTVEEYTFTVSGHTITMDYIDLSIS